MSSISKFTSDLLIKSWKDLLFSANESCTPRNCIPFNEKATGFFETSDYDYLLAYHYIPEDRGSSSTPLRKRASWQVSAGRVADLL